MEDNNCDINYKDLIKLIAYVGLMLFSIAVLIGGMTWFVSWDANREPPKQEINHNNYVENKGK